MPGSQKVETFLSGKEGKEQGKRVGMRRVRVICTDPDATESSSDEQDEEPKRGSLQKRIVREMFIPALFPQEPAEESIRDCKLVGAIPHSFSSSALSLLPYKRNSSKTSSKRSPKKWRLQRVSSMSNTSSRGALHAETGKKACRYIGVRQRRWGKWTAELRESSQGLRLWLGTFDSAKEAAIAYDEAARKLKGAEAITNFGGSPPSSTLPSPDVHLGQFGNHRNDSWPHVDMCVDDNELLLSCADLEAMEDCLLPYSPASVLDLPNSSDSTGLFLSSPSSVLESTFTDDCASAPFQAFDAGLAAGNGGEECRSSRYTSARCVGENKVNLAISAKMEHSVKHEPTALEEPVCEVFGELFDYEGSNFAREDGLAGHELVSFESMSEDEGANLMSFELDAEALTWINFQS